MKKALFIIVALASVAIGCTKSEVVKAPGRGREIKFDTYVGKTPMTKAESADLAYVQRELAAGGGFQVYAFLHNAIPYTPDPETGDTTYLNVSSVGTSTAYMDKVVSWQGPELPDTTQGTPGHNGFWDYKGVVYWPDHTTSRKLAFAAYGLNADVTVDGVKLIQWESDETVAGNDKANHPAGQSYTKFTYTVPTTVADQKDLLVAKYLADQKYDETAQNPGTVNFTFSHLLSRIGFSLVTKVDGTLVSVEQVDITGNFYSAGQVDLANAQETTIMIGETEYKQNRPFITPTGTAASTTYSLLPVSTDYTASFTSVGAVDGAPIYDNSMLWVKDYGMKTDSADDDAYVSKFPKSETEKDQHDVNATGYDAAKKAADDNLNNRYMMIIPVKGTEHNAVLKVKYFLPGAGSFASADINLSTIDFEPGKSYDFKLKVSTNGIKFEVSVESWDETMHDPENNPIFNLN
jgi:hypothetical protein